MFANDSTDLKLSYAFNSAIANSWGTKTKARDRFTKISLNYFLFSVALFDISNNAKRNPVALWAFGKIYYNFEGTWFIKQRDLLTEQNFENFRNHL